MEDEPEALRERYGRTPFAQGALLARRLVEAGVRFVTVSRGFNTWDHHKDIFPNLSNTFLPELDRAYSALLEDLHQRGLLDSTLVIMTDRKSTRLNSSHLGISYAVFCLKKKKKNLQ